MRGLRVNMAMWVVVGGLPCVVLMEVLGPW